jgi:hypothetical protein
MSHATHEPHYNAPCDTLMRFLWYTSSIGLYNELLGRVYGLTMFVLTPPLMTFVENEILGSVAWQRASQL